MARACGEEAAHLRALAQGLELGAPCLAPAEPPAPTPTEKIRLDRFFIYYYTPSEGDTAPDAAPGATVLANAVRLAWTCADRDAHERDARAVERRLAATVRASTEGLVTPQKNGPRRGESPSKNPKNRPSPALDYAEPKRARRAVRDWLRAGGRIVPVGEGGALVAAAAGTAELLLAPHARPGPGVAAALVHKRVLNHLHHTGNFLYFLGCTDALSPLDLILEFRPAVPLDAFLLESLVASGEGAAAYITAAERRGAARAATNALLCQVLLALQSARELHPALSHGDLGAPAVLVESLPRETTFHYAVGNGVAAVRARHRAIVTGWERATARFADGALLGPARLDAWRRPGVPNMLGDVAALFRDVVALFHASSGNFSAFENAGVDWLAAIAAPPAFWRAPHRPAGVCSPRRFALWAAAPRWGLNPTNMDADLIDLLAHTAARMADAGLPELPLRISAYSSFGYRSIG